MPNFTALGRPGRAVPLAGSPTVTVPRPDPACLRRRSHWVELEAHEASVRRARRDVSASLGVWRVPDDLCADAELLTSELATNAVRHTLGATFLCQVTLMQDESV